MCVCVCDEALAVCAAHAKEEEEEAVAVVAKEEEEKEEEEKEEDDGGGKKPGGGISVHSPCISSVAKNTRAAVIDSIAHTHH